MGTLVITNTLANLAAGNQPLSKIDTNFADIVAVINGNIDAVNCPALNNKEASLGNPPVDAYVLSSTVAGVRSWIAQSGASGVTPNMQVFTSNGTWTKPAGVSKIIAMCWGAGGGGGGGGAATRGDGAGSGAFGFGVFTVTGNVSVVIGSAGSAGGIGTGGSAGQQSSISGGGLPGSLTCGGGAGGPSSSGIGGNGGSAGAGWLFGVNGQKGAGAHTYGSGCGGDAPQGGGGGPELFTSITTNGNNAAEPGGGGGGGPTNKAGGDGAKGRVVIIWFA